MSPEGGSLVSRKDTLRAMLSGRGEELRARNPAPQDVATPATEDAAKPSGHFRSSVVGAMGRSLGQIANAAEHARQLIANGASIVELPADKLDPSFISDRLSDEGPGFSVLLDAIREQGQRSPILVRPHPEVPDRFQIAFGHRRVRALKQLGRPVRAVVQNLSDEEFVVVQGQENSARADLSLIERGLFAASLEERGFDRQLIMAALGVDKSYLSRLLSLARAIPREIAVAIGPAPKAGEPRWQALAHRLSEMEWRSRLETLTIEPAFQQADSDQRFLMVLEAFAPRRPEPKRPKLWTAPDGKKPVRISAGDRETVLSIQHRAAPDFAAFLIEQLPDIYESYAQRRAAASSEDRGTAP
ncbi:plasmid partitioning protein RepB [Terrarubrum flagellatum]|uniref:plasmid partitioning protein RepB n=1 Tax=Terrirubrum flagellatum TaxID=2895980 RepID=UPI003145326F